MEKDKYKETIEVYEQLGKKYVKDIAGVNSPGLVNFIKVLKKGDLILDVGCAGGRDSKKFIQKGFTVIGIDLVDEFLEQAKKDVPEAAFKKMDLLNLRFPKDHFDAIWAHAVLLHIEKKDTPKALRGFYRILKTGGKLYILVKEGRGAAYKKEKLSGGKRRWFVYFQKDELEKFVEEVGFKVIFAKYIPDELGRKDVNWIGLLAEKKTKQNKKS